MVEKLDEISADVKLLCESKQNQDLINMQVLRAIEDLNQKNAEQEAYLDNLKLFAWIGKNWKELLAALLTFGGLIIAWIGLKK